MNTNCLEHTACPQCGNDAALKIAAKTLAHVTDDGAETFGDLEWDDQSFAACPTCGREGKLGEFRLPSSEEAQPGIPLTTFNVHLYREMRLFFPGIEAPSHEVAASWASQKPDDEAALIDDCDGETLAALVDVAGDEAFEHSRMISFDPAREATHDLVTALGNLCAQIEGAYGDIDLSEANAALAKACGASAPASLREAGPMNEKRTAWASAALTSFCLITGQHAEEETGEAICDLICDLLHLAKAKGFHPDALVAQGIGHYEYEILHPDE
jgi:hypothetical protein